MDAASWSARRVLELGDDWCGSVGWSADGETLAVGASNATVWLYDRATGSARSLSGSTDEILYAVSISPDGALVAAEGGRDGVALWDRASGRLLARIHAVYGDPFHLRFTPGGEALLSSHADGTVRLWSLEDLHTPAEALEAQWLRRLGVTFQGDDELAMDSGWALPP